MLQKLKTNHYYLVVLILISLIYFLPAYKTGMVTDFLGWVSKYEAGSFKDVWSCFGYTGLHQFFHLINFSFYKLFGLNLWIWSIWFCLLHSTVAYLMYLTIKRVEADLSLETNGLVAYIAPLLFLISPYQFEVLTWKACMHYLLVSGLFLSQFLLISALLKEFVLFKLGALMGIAMLALFTLELSLIFPLIFLLYVILYNHNNWQSSLRQAGRIVLPLFILVVGYFLMNMYFLGDWVGHYGSDRHFDINVFKLSSHACKYFLKYFLLASLSPFGLKGEIYGWTESYLGITVIVLILVSLSAVLLFKWKKGHKRSGFTLLGLLGFFLAIAPVVSLFFYKDMFNENDRYSYFASIFFYIFVVNMILFLKPVYRELVLILIIAFHLYFGLTMRAYAIEAGRAYYGLTSNFPENENGDIWVLGIPDNYAGLYLFRDWKNDGTSLRESYELLLEKELEDNISVVCHYNMMNPDDHFHAEWADSLTIKVAIGQDGTWFWRKAIGASDYSNEEFEVNFKGWYYLLKIKKEDKDRIYIYPDGHSWKVLPPYASN